MLNSNMQCSHHGNGGSSEASHGAEIVCFVLSVCLRVSVCESMPLAFLQRFGTICRVPMDSNAAGECVHQN